MSRHFPVIRALPGSLVVTLVRVGFPSKVPGGQPESSKTGRSGAGGGPLRESLAACPPTPMSRWEFGRKSLSASVTLWQVEHWPGTGGAEGQKKSLKPATLEMQQGMCFLEGLLPFPFQAAVDRSRGLGLGYEVWTVGAIHRGEDWILAAGRVHTFLDVGHADAHAARRLMAGDAGTP